ncbi:MAG: FHA domain-containing protein [Lachnospiraceae bacterium]|nr:FHA domain-containing protein [Lachnospiraceae bacterium]
MQGRYVRNLQHQYYIIGGAGAGAAPGKLDYKEQMLVNNTVPGVLPLRIELRDNDKEYYFCTDGLQSVGHMFERRKMSSEFIGMLICKIAAFIAASPDFFLCENDYVIGPESIFASTDADKVGLVYVSGYDRDLKGQLEDFLEYVMEHLDYNDRNASYITYSVYAKCKKEGVTLDELSAEAFKWQQGADLSEEEKEQIICTEKEAQIINYDEALKQAKGERRAKTGKHAGTDNRKSEDIQKNGDRQAHKKKGIISVLKKAVKLITEFAAGDDEYGEDEDERGGSNLDEKDSGDLSEYRVESIPGEPEEQETLKGTGPALAYLKGEAERIPITELPFFVGRMERQCDLCINATGISRYHARIGKSESSFVLADLNTTGGTYLNEVKLEPGFEEPLMDGDEIRFADYRYIFCLPGDTRTA